MKHLILLLLCTVIFVNCADTGGYVYPTLADEHMTFSIDGQEIVLNGLTYADRYYNKLEIFGSNPSDNFLLLTRSSADGETTMFLQGRDLPIRKEEKALFFTSEGYAPVTISVTTNSLGGSIYCPKAENRTSFEYQALLRFDSYDTDGRMTGTFMTDPAATNNPVNMTNGSFSLFVKTEDR